VIGDWCVKLVTDMTSMFHGKTTFNSNISNWRVNFTNMERMFSGASSFNQDISKWNVSAVTNMIGMFNLAVEFNSDISGWDVRSPGQYMFKRATKFNQNLCPWGSKLSSTFNYGSLIEMFALSGCPNTNSPTGRTGPWCKATCP
jgi:surface protein